MGQGSGCLRRSGRRPGFCNIGEMENEKNDRQGLLPNVIIRLDDITLKECKKACLELAGSRKECVAIEWNMYAKACVLFDSTKSFSSPSSGSVFSTKSCETRPRPPMPGGCSGTLWGCRNDGETSARGPNQLGCPEDPIFS